MTTLQIRRYFIIISLLLIQINICNSQNNMFSLKDAQNFQSKQQKEFNRIVEKNQDAYFVELSKTWNQIQVNQALPFPVNDKKPENLPSIDITKLRKIPKILFINPTKQDCVLLCRTTLPLIAKAEDTDKINLSQNVTFYGTELCFTIDRRISENKVGEVSEKRIAEYWKKMGQTNHYQLIKHLYKLQDSLNLPDYGFYKLTNALCQAIFPADINQSELLTWYLMTKSGFDVKIAICNKNIKMLYTTDNQLYNIPYITINNIKYYGDLEKNTPVKIPAANYEPATNKMSFAISKALNLTRAEISKNYQFNYHEKMYSFNFKLNKNVIDFYENYPQTGYSNYFDAVPSTVLKESIEENLIPLLEKLSDFEKVNFLLAFVQNIFNYQKDAKQFGRERCMFPDELFYFPFSDSDDRAVLFSYLIKKYVGLEVVGLQYPGHYATAIAFSGDIEGDFFNYKNKKFVICDPTLINAPIGYCANDYVELTANVLPQSNSMINSKFKNDLWNMLASKDVFPAGKGQNSAFDKDGNCYVTGYFNGKTMFDSLSLLSILNSNDVFLAKFSPKKELFWMQKIGGPGNDYGYNIAVDKSGNCYINGSFDRTIVIGDNQIETTPEKRDDFIAKFNTNGEFIWFNQIEIDSIPVFTNFNYVVNFDSVGDIASRNIFTDIYNNISSGLFINENDNYVIGNVEGFYFETEYIEFTSRSFTTSKDYLTKDWMSERTKLIKQDYVASVAGMFAFMNAFKSSGSFISGIKIIELINLSVPHIKTQSKDLYYNISKIQDIRNDGGIITITSKDGTDILINQIHIKNKAKLKITTYKGGNAQITILSGVKLGKTFDLNYVKIFKNSGDIILDYDSEHSQSKINIDRDILKNNK